MADLDFRIPIAVFTSQHALDLQAEVRGQGTEQGKCRLGGVAVILASCNGLLIPIARSPAPVHHAKATAVN